MTRAIAQTVNMTAEYRKEIVRAFAIACIMLAGIYVLYFYSVISKAVALQKAEADIASLSKAVEILDTEYLSLSSRITSDGLESYGFREGKVSAYISRTASLGKVAIGANEL